MVTTPERYKTQARAMLDSASLSSFITERLAQRLRLPRHCHHVQVASIGGPACGPSSYSVVSLHVASMCPPKSDSYRESQWEVEAIVLNYLHRQSNTTKIGSTWQN